MAAVVLKSWGNKKPDQRLVDRMIEKARAYHIITDPKFVYGPRWPQEDGTVASYDEPCWHIRDDLCTGTGRSHALEGCQALLEGLEEGWILALQCYPPAPPKKGRK